VLNISETFICDGEKQFFWLARNPDHCISVNAPGVFAEFRRSGRKIFFTRAPLQGTMVASYCYDETFAWYELNQEEKEALHWDCRLRVTWENNLYEYMRRPSADWQPLAINFRQDVISIYNRRFNSIGLPALGQVQETAVNDGAIIPDLSGLSSPDLSGLSSAFESLGVSVAAAVEGVSRIPRTFSHAGEDYVVYEPRADVNPDGTWQVTTHTTTAQAIPAAVTIPFPGAGNLASNVVLSPLFTCIICGERFYGEPAFSTHQNAMHPPIPKILIYQCPWCAPTTITTFTDLVLFHKHVELVHKKVTPTTPVKAKKTGQRPDRTGIIADDFNPDDDIEINF
jgi:hypothetical protein